MAKNTAEPINVQGEISIHSENIMPIIKKWLYSEKEIFVRELVSNAFDAISKLNKIATIEGLTDIPKPLINIIIDKKAKTVTIRDTGLGMTAEEIQKYINQIAFSGAEEFAKKYAEKDSQNAVIGHFGLGFYSAFMVSKKVEIATLSYQPGSTAIRWACDGSTSFSIVEDSKADIGSDIILYIDDENKEFLDDARMTDLVKRYANFLPVEIQVNGVAVNNQNPLWQKNPNEVTDAEYQAFFQAMFPMSAPPLFWIHLNVDYPFNLQGILYFPTLSHELEAKNGDVKLFCQQVFVTDDAKSILPEFLTLLKGAIDCPDIPLNVSRSYLQNDPYVQKISKHIVKKIADKLKEIQKKDQAQYETYWADIHPFIKYGMMTNTDFYDKVKDQVIFKSSTDSWTRISDYLERNKEKLDKTVLYCADPNTQSAYVELCRQNGLEVIYLNGLIDTHFISFLESKETDVKYQSVNADITHHLVDASGETEAVDPADNKTKTQKLETLYQDMLKKDKLTIKAQALKSSDLPGLLVESEMSRRMAQMSVFMKADPKLFEEFSLIVNTNHPLNDKLLSLAADASRQDELQSLCNEVYDLAYMAFRPLEGDRIQAFIKRTVDYLSK